MKFRFYKRVAHLAENPLIQLVNYEVIILMDDSISMGGTRWKQAKKVMKKVVKEAAKYDQDGIEIEFLNSEVKSKHTKTKEEVKDLFENVKPSGATPLGPRLNDLCKKYIKDFKEGPKNQKRCLIIAITDGEPTSKQAVKDAIKEAAKDLDKLAAPVTQLGIQFVQIGNDTGATIFLTELDKNLKGDGEGQVGRDIVDTTPYSGSDLTPEQLLKILAGAINKKVDRSDEPASGRSL